MRLCGISSRFRLLSPCVRQVTHALLTRPPLSVQSSVRRLPSVHSVRLACVRHAASVHPEPGSNSQIKVEPFFRINWLFFQTCVNPFVCSLLQTFYCFKVVPSLVLFLNEILKKISGLSYCSIIKVLLLYFKLFLQAFIGLSLVFLSTLLS